MREDIFRDIGHMPDIRDPSINVVDDNRLKYQFYKVIKGLHGLNRTDQDKLKGYIDELTSNEDLFDQGDLLYYSPYKVLKHEEKQSDPTDIPCVEYVDPDDDNNKIKYRPFMLVYQSKEMRLCMIKYGTNIVSMDSTHGTTKYGFKVFALVSLDEFRHVRTCGLIILQHETKAMLIVSLNKLKHHMDKVVNFNWNPRVVIVDKSDAEIGAVEAVLPFTLVWLCWVHVDRDWDRKLCTYVGKTEAIVVKRLLEKMKFVRSEATAIETMKQILGHALVFDDVEFKKYLQGEWFSERYRKMWCNCHR